MDFGVNYLKSIPGVLKIIESVLSLLCFICATIHETSWYWALLSFLKTAAIASLFFCVILFLFRALNCVKVVQSIHWNKFDCICSLIFAILFIISSLLFCNYDQPSGLRAAIIFAYLVSTVFVLDTFYKIIYLLQEAQLVV